MGWPRRTVAATLLLLLAGAGVAHAEALDANDPTLGSWGRQKTGITDEFTGDGVLVGRTTDEGSWHARGEWSTSADKLVGGASGGCAGVASVGDSLDLGAELSTNASTYSALAVRMSEDCSSAVIVAATAAYGSPQVILGRVDNGNVTPWAGVGTAAFQSSTKLHVRVANGRYTVWRGTTQVLAHTPSAAQTSGLTGNLAGFMALASSSTSSYDDLQLSSW